MTRLYQPAGTELADGGLEQLKSAFERQRVAPDQLLERLREERERQADFIADTRTLRMVPVSEELAADLPMIPQSERLQPAKPKVAIVAANREEEWYEKLGPLAANSHAHEQLGGKLQIPRTYYKRMLNEAPELLSTNVNNWLESKPEQRMVRTMRTNGGGPAMSFVRGFLSNRYRRLDALEIGEAILPSLADPSNGWEMRECGVTDVRVHIEAVYPNLTEEITVGDAVALGVKISTSDVGSGAFSVQLGVLRLVCANLMVVPDYSKRQIHLGGAQDELVELLSDRTLRAEDDLLISKMRDVVLNMADSENFSKLVGNIKQAAGAELADPIAATQLLTRNAGLKEFELNAVQGELVRSGNPTMWGLTNALTATAREMDFERKAGLEAFAGSLINDLGGWKQYIDAAA